MRSAHRPRPCARQSGNVIAGVAVGLLIGILIAVGIALFINSGNKAFVQRDEKPAGAASEPALPSAPIALPGKPGDRPVERPSYDFYKILPGGDAASVPVSTGNGEPPQADRLYLQAGAFKDPSEADNLKARLALMGMEAGVQKVDTTDKGTLQRVRVGPFAAQADADNARARLAQEGIETVIVHVKPGK